MKRIALLILTDPAVPLLLSASHRRGLLIRLPGVDHRDC